MKRLIKISLTAFASVLLFFSSGCDDFNSLPLNIPITVNFSMDGGALSSTRNFCLDEYASYTDFQDNIENIQLLRVIYRTFTVTPTDLKGDIRIVVTQDDGTGTVLVNQVISGVIPADYISPNQPLEFILTQEELQAFNAYLSQLNNLCFSATISVENISAGDPPFQLSGAVDILFEAETSF
ncbi:MAG: hypothetical protein IPJ03_09615 [Ignavibacteriales bacterium]|nr:hypothetical protein [Ignavibacteriales bacterium]